MPPKHDVQPEKFSGDPSDPQGMNALARAYVESVRVRAYSEGTIKKRRLHLNLFIQWCDERDVNRPDEVTRQLIERYQRHLFHGLGKRGKPLSFSEQHSRLCTLRAWFKWLARANHLVLNPASELELPKLSHRLPRHILSKTEVEEVLNQPDVSTPFGMRDRAMLETLYSTGIRRMELASLQLHDVDVERGVITVRQGKGRKDRVVPIGERALAWIQKYREDVRPKLLINENESTLFLTRFGEAFSDSSLSLKVSEYVGRASIGKQGSCHLFRHTMATLMHDNGADVRYVQAMLGHAKLDTTQIYTQVSIRKLKQVHEATHPAKQQRDESARDNDATL